jgi:ABC-type thiamin/hydroxymethylpyrimidine transport system permease subunit
MIARFHATDWQAHSRGESSAAMLAKIAARFPYEFVKAGFRAKTKYLALIAVNFRLRVHANGCTAYRIFA